jgi:hypothetical protein
MVVVVWDTSQLRGTVHHAEPHEQAGSVQSLGILVSTVAVLVHLIRMTPCFIDHAWGFQYPFLGVNLVQV